MTLQAYTYNIPRVETAQICRAVSNHVCFLPGIYLVRTSLRAALCPVLSDLFIHIPELRIGISYPVVSLLSFRVFLCRIRFVCFFAFVLRSPTRLGLGFVFVFSVAQTPTHITVTHPRCLDSAAKRTPETKAGPGTRITLTRSATCRVVLWRAHKGIDPDVPSHRAMHGLIQSNPIRQNPMPRAIA